MQCVVVCTCIAVADLLHIFARIQLYMLQVVYVDFKTPFLTVDELVPDISLKLLLPIFSIPW
jgi:hypothetical protein